MGLDRLDQRPNEGAHILVPGDNSVPKVTKKSKWTHLCQAEMVKEWVLFHQMVVGASGGKCIYGEIAAHLSLEIGIANEAGTHAK